MKLFYQIKTLKNCEHFEYSDVENPNNWYWELDDENFCNAIRKLSEDEIHSEIVNWIELEGLPLMSLDELMLECYDDDEPIMSKKQLEIGKIFDRMLYDFDIDNSITANEESKNLLLHAVINQLESDFEGNNFESLDDFLTKLIKNKENHSLMIDYLSDENKEQWLEGKTNTNLKD